VPIPTGKGAVEVKVKSDWQTAQAPATITFRADGEQVGQGRVERSATSGFSGSETFDSCTDLGSPVSLDYHKRAPFEFNGRIERVNIKFAHVQLGAHMDRIDWIAAQLL
jgi:hypothetical protein